MACAVACVFVFVVLVVNVVVVVAVASWMDCMEWKGSFDGQDLTPRSDLIRSRCSINCRLAFSCSRRYIFFSISFRSRSRSRRDRRRSTCICAGCDSSEGSFSRSKSQQPAKTGGDMVVAEVRIQRFRVQQYQQTIGSLESYSDANGMECHAIIH